MVDANRQSKGQKADKLVHLRPLLLKPDAPPGPVARGAPPPFSSRHMFLLKREEQLPDALPRFMLHARNSRRYFNLIG